MRAAMGLSPSDEPSSQDHPPQRPIDDNTFYGKMLSGHLNAARGALELPPAAAPYLNPAQEALVHALLAIPLLRGAKSASVKICMWIVGTIIVTIGVAWCTPATLSVIRLRQSDRHHMLLRLVGISWGAYEGE
jgi:hypothetical protein